MCLTLAPKRMKRSDRFLDAIADSDALILTHDNPDPDAIASGWGLALLVHEELGWAPRFMARGAIVRAENALLVKLLAPPLELVDSIPLESASIVVVDCVPTSTNNPLNGSDADVKAVIDHHEPKGLSFRVPFKDVRPNAAATASIVGTYLREQDVEPDAALATAMLYAIRSETAGQDTRLSRTDQATVRWLSGFADYGKLAEIENAPLSRAYYCDVLLAMETTFLYDDTAVAFLPQASGAETVGEIADLLVRCGGIERVLCGAVVAGDVVLSARTTCRGGNAVDSIGAVLRGYGHWGGHERRAGGKIPEVPCRNGGLTSLFEELKSRWLAACRIEQQRGTRLVRKQDILAAL